MRYVTLVRNKRILIDRSIDRLIDWLIIVFVISININITHLLNYILIKKPIEYFSRCNHPPSMSRLETGPIWVEMMVEYYRLINVRPTRFLFVCRRCPVVIIMLGKTVSKVSVATTLPFIILYTVSEGLSPRLYAETVSRDSFRISMPLIWTRTC